MEGIFDIAAGSVTGRGHLKPMGEKNNQDAFSYYQDSFLSVGVVCDGCSSEPNSEVGAKLMSQLLIEKIKQLEMFAAHTSGYWESASSLLELLEKALLNSQVDIYSQIGPSAYEDRFKQFETVRQTIFSNFLFTIVAFVVTAKWTCIFSIGDGVAAINGKVFSFGITENNQPDYFGYYIQQKVLTNNDPSQIFRIQTAVPTYRVKSLLIGTDGLLGFSEAEGMNLPGKEEPVGPISQFWEEDVYFSNPDQIRRRLALTNREVIRPDWEKQILVREPGLLEDDTTLVVIRRKKEEGGQTDGGSG